MRIKTASLMLYCVSLISVASPVAVANEANFYWRVGDVFVEQAWARVVSGGLQSGAVYLTIHNLSPSPDILLAVDSPASQTMVIHESQRVGDKVSMQPLPDGVALSSRAEVVMRPGKIHVMLVGVSETVKAGRSLPVRVAFRNAGALNFDVPVIPLSLVRSRTCAYGA